MEPLIKEGIKCIADTLISDITLEKYAEMQDMLKGKRLAKIFLQVVENVGERFGRDFEIPKEALTEEMLLPGQTSEALSDCVEGILNQYVLEGEHSEEDVAILRQICQEYLKSVRSEIVNADVIREIHAMNAEQSVGQKKLQELCSRIEQMLRTPSMANSTIEYQKLYKKSLFWDEHITLDKVYMEPKVQGTDERVTKILNDFLNNKDKYLLVIEGAPGIGKSSLLGMLADNYMHKPYFFLRLSDLGLQKTEEIQTALSRLITIDYYWTNYQKSGNVLFLDGYDEVQGKLSSDQVISFVKLMKRKDVKVVITTRPNYWIENTDICQKICIREYGYSQVEEWIRNYLRLKGCDDVTIENKIKQLNYRRDNEAKTINSNESIIDVLGIPIFLYIIYNKNINLNEISSKTELYEDVFMRLLEDKSDEKHYAQEVAMCLGYFLQATEQPKFLKKMRNQFQMLLSHNHVVIDESEQCNLDALLGNSFIRKISEGDEEREFYHKSIKDYFSAKYIMKKIEYCYDESEYVSLLDKHDLREEIPHLQYFINKKSEEDKKSLGRCLQQYFLKGLSGRLKATQEVWFDGINDREHVSVLDIAERNRKIFENQMQIMHTIFEMPIVEDEEAEHDCLYAAALVMAKEFMCRKTKEMKEQFFWQAFRYSILREDNIGSCIRQEDFSRLLKHNIYI